MANQITDNRTLVDNADSATPYDNLAGAASGTLDTEIFRVGTGSIGYSTQNTRDGLLFDAGSAQDWSNNHFYFLVNCGIVGLLDIKANGGLTIRYCGATVTDWFEVRIAGSDSWPASIDGGWTPFVVDIETARATAITNSWTNGTVPATTAIRYVGISTITAGTMPRMVDNTWLDEIRRLPDGSPGIIVEGRNGGATDWNYDDIIGTAAIIDAATALRGPGGSVILSTSIQFGINDTSTHGFLDTNQTILWDDQEFIAADLYSLSALGNAGGTTNITAGVKTGAGDAATGAQGWTIAAAGGGQRWSLDFNDANLDLVALYGCSFQHGSNFLLDSAVVSVISSLYVDCSSALVTGSEQLRNKIINANTADGVAFMTTDDLGDIVFNEFAFSDGHAVELTTPRVASQTSKGNLFTGYGATASNDAEIYNNTAGAVTITATDNSDVGDFRNGASASTTIVNAVDLKVTVTNQVGNLLQSMNVRYEESDGTQIAQGSTDALGEFVFSIDVSALPLTNAKVIVRNKAFEDSDTILPIPTGGFDIPIKLEPDPDVVLP